jgi:hypothetical protein
MVVSDDAKGGGGTSNKRPRIADDAKVVETSLHYEISHPQLEGKYTLSPDSRRGTLRRSGSYTFNRSTSELSAVENSGSDPVSVGTFVFQPISDRLLGNVSGFESLPSISICDSEIMGEIQKHGNDGAVFVLPSQLNGAEYPSHRSVVEDVNSYQYDNTGGPRGQLACHPAVAQFILNNAANDNREGGIDAVQEIIRAMHEAGFPGFKLQNGYLVIPPLRPSARSKAASVFQNNLHKMAILSVVGVPARGLTPNKSALSSATHNVDLVYASAVPVQTYTNSTGSEHREFQETIAEMVLMGQYLGALKLAAKHASPTSRKKVFLMQLGGGVFQNPFEIILQGMSKAVELLGPQERERLDIRVLTWSGNSLERIIVSKLLKEHRKLIVNK